MNPRLRKTLIGSLAALAVAAVTASPGEAAYPGEPGSIVYNKYRDIEVRNEESGLLELHPEGGLVAHGSRSSDQPMELTSEVRDSSPNVSPNGRLIAFTRTLQQDGLKQTNQIFLIHPDGSGLRQLTDEPAGSGDPFFSPDGRRLVFVRSHHLWSLRLPTGSERQLTFGPYSEREPVFTPSGRRILFASDRAQDGGKHDTSDIWAVGSDGRNPRILIGGSGAEVSPEVAPDGKRIAFVVEQNSYSGYGDLRIARSNGRVVRSLDEKPGVDCRPCYGSPSWSPDGRHLATVEKVDNVGSSVLMVITPDGRHHRQFDRGIVSTEGTGRHVSEPAWGPKPGVRR